jgi:hypothetical protein
MRADRQTDRHEKSNSTNNFIVTYFKYYTKDLIFYILKLVLMLLATYPSENTSLKIATKGGQNIYEAYDFYSVINSHIFNIHGSVYLSMNQQK